MDKFFSVFVGCSIFATYWCLKFLTTSAIKVDNDRMATESFLHRIRWFILVCSFCGLYVAGAEKLFRFLPRKLLLTCVVIFHLTGWFNIVDNLISMVHTFGSSDFYPLAATNGVVVWVFISSTYIAAHEKNFRKLIQIWDEKLQPELYSKERKRIIDEQRRLAFKKWQYLTLFVFLPFLAYHINAIVHAQLFIASVFGDDITQPANRFGVTLKAFSYYFWLLTYGLYQCFLTVVMRTILAEFQYLSYFLEQILNDVKINVDGSVYYKIQPLKNFDSQRANKDIHIKLKTFVKYHVDVLKFCNTVKKIYSPVVFYELFTLTTFLCFSIICGMAGYVQPDVAFVVISSMLFHCFMTSLHCQIGDEIRDLNIGLRDIAFHGNWMAYPTPVRKVLIIIMAFAQEKPFSINPFGLYPLVMHTFGSMSYLQYQVLAFLSDMRK